MKAIVVFLAIISIGFGLPNGAMRSINEGTCQYTFVVPSDVAPPTHSCSDTEKLQADLEDLQNTVEEQQVNVKDLSKHASSIFRSRSDVMRYLGATSRLDKKIEV